MSQPQSQMAGEVEYEARALIVRRASIDTKDVTLEVWQPAKFKVSDIRDRLPLVRERPHWVFDEE